MYEMREKDGYAVVIDHNGKSIVDIVEQFDEEMGCKVLTPVFTPEMAWKVSRLLNGGDPLSIGVSHLVNMAA